MFTLSLMRNKILQNEAEHRKGNRKGFTLMELLIVVVIIGILALAMRLYWPKLTMGAKVNTWKSNIDAFQTALDLYSNDHGGHYPTPPSAATAFSQWANAQGLDKYLQKPLVNPFYPDQPVEISNSTSVTAINDKNLGTTNAAIIGFTTSTDSDGLDHYTITYKIGDNTFTLYDQMSQAGSGSGSSGSGS